MEINGNRFKAIEATKADCTGCMLQGDRHAVCIKAAEIAKAHDMPDCDDRAPSGKSYIYVPDHSDPRQLVIPMVPA